QDPLNPPINESEFEEIMSRNRTVSSSAIARAVADASTGEFASAIETLVTAISLIKQSKVANDDRCKILISSLQDTLHGIESKSYSTRSKDRPRSRERDRSRERSSRREKSSRRDRSRSRERDYRDRSRERDRYHEGSLPGQGEGAPEPPLSWPAFTTRRASPCGASVFLYSPVATPTLHCFLSGCTVKCH
ncbi:hypothetical protein MTO96_051852, partial [Rhipicephalus appendiculatus]